MSAIDTAGTHPFLDSRCYTVVAGSPSDPGGRGKGTGGRSPRRSLDTKAILFREKDEASAALPQPPLNIQPRSDNLQEALWAAMEHAGTAMESIEERTGRPKAAGDGRFSANALLQAAFVSDDNVVLLVDAESRRVLACNSATERVFGYKPEELTGRDTRDLHVDDAYFECFGLNTCRVLAGERSCYHGHYWMRRRDGTRFPSEHLIYAINGDSQAAAVVISVIRDVSESGIPLRADVTPETAGGGFQGLAWNLPGIVYQQVRTADGSDRYTFLAGALFEQYGIDPASIRFDPAAFLEHLDPMDREQLEIELARSAASLSPIDMQLRFHAPAGHVVWLRAISQPRKLDDGSVAWDGLALDITRERVAEEQLHYLATHDRLTGLPNRYQFLEYLGQAITRAERRDIRFAIAHLHIDGMDEINRTHGFAIGDDLLKQIGRRLVKRLPPQDVVARTHGDGFMALLTDAGDQAQLRKAVRRLQRVFDGPFTLDQSTTVEVTVKIGFATYPADGQTPEELLHASGIAIDRISRQHGSAFRFYGEDLGRALNDLMDGERKLSDAIEAGQIKPYFQPQFSLENGELVGMEALARWETADGKFVSPNRFIALAEETGLMVPLGMRMLSEVASRVREWRAAGLHVPPVCVNCASQQLRSSEFKALYLRETVQGEIDPEILIIELTESSLMEDVDAAERTMRSLTASGVRFSIDDFGTGFSSLSYLARLPFNVLKIDRNFVSALGDDDRQRAITQSLIGMSKALGLQVIAEGVETEAQQAMLKQLGCDAAQGFLYSPAVPAVDMLRWLSPRGVDGERR